MGKGNIYPLQIIHCNLIQGLPALKIKKGWEGVYLVLWWENIPLGDLTILKNELPVDDMVFKKHILNKILPTLRYYIHKQGLPVHQKNLPLAWMDTNLKEFNHILKNVFQNEESKIPSKSVSVLICTRNRSGSLYHCLNSLKKSNYKPLEILVIDNAPEDDNTQLVTQKFEDIRYILEPEPGLDVARNTGINNARGEIVAFTDDDVIVHPDWILNISKAFSEKRTMAVTGLVIASELATEGQIIFEKYWSFNRGYLPKTFDHIYFSNTKNYGIPVWEFGAGANMAFRKEIFQLIGGFDERLDVGAAGCSGDSELWYRILAEGWHCQYDPSAVVYHKHRRDRNGLKKQLFNYMRGHVAALFIQYERYRHKGNMWRLFWVLPVYYIRLLIRGLAKGYQYRYSTLFAEITGCFSGVKFYIQQRNRI